PRAALAGDPFDERLRTTQDYDLWFRLAKTWRFVHLPELLVRARAHPAQGTHRMKDIVLDECNSLLGGFALELDDAELSRASSRSPACGRLELAENLRDRGFLGAARQALAGLRVNLPDDRDLADALEALTLERWRLLNEAVLAAEQQVTAQAELASQRAQAADREAALRAHIEALFGSASWRITRPLRWVSRLLAAARAPRLRDG
ncbi:MAG: hypothetical protein EBY30_11435, partial [Rhodospirillales bacterium]|nr:hypothetical protein [Rhodospirillales bacterium]